MDDFPVFENFLSEQFGLTVIRARGETVGFVKSFTALLATSDAEIDDFVKSMHTTNSDRPANGKILRSASTMVALKDLLFELEYSSRCGALPVLATLQALDAVQVNYMQFQRKKSVADKSNFAALCKLPEIMVPKLMAGNYDIFTTSLCSVVGRNIGMNRIPIDNFMRGDNGNYDSPWMNQEDKLNNCLLQTGNSFKNDNITL